MVKKVKIADLEDENDSDFETEFDQSKKVKKAGIDDLPNKETSSPKVTTQEILEQHQKKVEESKKEDPKNLRATFFELSQKTTFYTKLVSYTVVLLILDVIYHFSKILDGHVVLNFEGFQSIYFDSDVKLNLIKISIYVLIVYMTVSKDAIAVNRKGIFCNKGKFSNIFFYNATVYLKWEDIHYASYVHRMFEPYLVFYDINNSEIGLLQFTIDEKKAFFEFISKNAGSEHPLSQLKKSFQ